MKYTILKIISLLCILSFTLNAQTKIPIRSSDELMPNSIFSQVPDEIRNSKPYLRYRWFYEQRAFPSDDIPEDAYKNSLDQRDVLRRVMQAKGIPSFNWLSKGPTPGYYSSYGNISSRIVTGAYHPSNPNIIYIGPANGGVWKSTDAGTSWIPKTDNEASLAMGAIVIDPVNPEIIYAGTGEATYSVASYYGRGLLKSTNGGDTWINITAGIAFFNIFFQIKNQTK